MAFRYGHSETNAVVQRISNSGVILEPVVLRESYFNPRVIKQYGVDDYFRGAAVQTQQTVDVIYVDGNIPSPPSLLSSSLLLSPSSSPNNNNNNNENVNVNIDLRNFLFGLPGSGGVDLASFNMQRGRDRGAPFYNDAREAWGMPRVNSFSEITNNTALASLLTDIFGSPDNCDAYVCCLAEGLLSTLPYPTLHTHTNNHNDDDNDDGGVYINRSSNIDQSSGPIIYYCY